MKTLNLRAAFAVSTTLFASLLFASAATAADWPLKPVRIIVGFAGGTGDLATRALASELNNLWKQPVLVENKPGAGGLIAYEFVAKSPGDGYTLLQGHAAYPIYHLITKNLRFDPARELQVAAMYGENLNMFVTNSLVPAKNYKEFIAYAKANPGKLNYASLGRSFIGLTVEAFKYLTGTQITEIAYKGSPAAITDFISNQTQLMYNPVQNLKPFIDKGQIRPLFVLAKNRVAEFPDVPTNFEVGLDKLTPKAWQGIIAPATTPRDIVNKINTDVVSIVSRPDFVKVLKNAGFEPLTPSLAEIQAFMDEDRARWTVVTKAANIQPED